MAPKLTMSPLRLGIVLTAIAFALVYTQTALAKTIPVTNTLDIGVGSLRDQIAKTAPGDTIVFSVAGVITLTSGQIAITKTLTISGPGTSVLAVSGNNAGGVFETHNTVQIHGLTVENGNSLADLAGGGIENYGTLVVTDVVFLHNSAYQGGGIWNCTCARLTVDRSTFAGNTASGDGGGIYNNSALTVSNSTFFSNAATYGGGGVLNTTTGRVLATGSTFVSNTASAGGGIGNAGALSVTRSTFSGNHADWDGGGIYRYGVLTLTLSSLLSNTAANNGAGIDNYDGVLTVKSSTFAGNTAYSEGGGLFNYPAGKTAVENSTFITNTAVRGGGIYNWGAMTLTFGTVVSNTANDAGGGIYNLGDTLIVRGTIVASSSSAGDCAGDITSDGYNLSSDATCSLIATGDISNTNPLLGPLQNNGGPTLTMMPLPGSPAIDAGGDNCPTTDQRGFSRPQNVHCDIGTAEALIRIKYLPIVKR